MSDPKWDQLGLSPIAAGGAGIYKGCGNMKVIELPGWANVNDNFGADGTWVSPVFSPGLSNALRVNVIDLLLHKMKLQEFAELVEMDQGGSIHSRSICQEGSPILGCL